MIKKISGLLSLVFIAMLASCSSDDSSNPNNTPTASFTATVDGQAWAAMTGGAVANLQTTEYNGQQITMLQIVGLKMDQSTVGIMFPIDNLTEGTYTFDSDAMGNLTYSAPGGFNSYTSLQETGSFTVTITDVNLDAGTITGTFSGTVLDFEGTDSIDITDGTFTSIPFMTSDFYSNGTMSLSRNGGASFTMDDNNSDGKFLMIAENSFINSINLAGYNTTVTQDLGVYSITFPKDVTAGTYDLASEGFGATIGNSEDEAQYTLDSGSITITSHNGNTVAGTFNYTVSNGTNTVTISNGSFSITHN